MIIDATIFAGETEMLKFRRVIIQDYVDTFVVVEDCKTHQGTPREYSEECTYRTNITPDGQERTVEIGQRNAIKDACDKFSDTDIVILSDIDEIPSRETLAEIRAHPEELPRTAALDFFYYRLNHRRPEICSLIIATVAELRRRGGDAIRHCRGLFPPTSAKPSGWHLSFFGGTKAIQNKLRSYSHCQFNKPEFLDEAWIEKCQKEGLGVLKCATQFTRTGPEFFPQYFLDAAPKEWWL